MPELGEQMYCHEQICIPPAFPYLLRQFAKAAIRTQPTDLLRWSAAYFRCLSLNIPPPVKPRLEYPIPRDHCGITPGWLKALLYQLQNNITIPFPILWDRWTGACLEHETLIQILVLGGFKNPEAIPLLRFIGLCAAHLTDDLTHTMILICEIMTEEPDGGSAMITVETFIDLYTFLSNIDASQPQILKNYYFTDALLNLYKEAAAKQEEEEKVKEESVAEEEREQEEMLDIVRYVGGVAEEDLGEDFDLLLHVGEEDEEDMGEEMPVGEEEEPRAIESVDTIQEEPRRIEPDIIEDDRRLNEDLMRLKLLQSEMAGESDTEIEKFKCRLIDEMPLTKSQEEAVLLLKVPTSKSELGSAGRSEEGVEDEEGLEGKGEDVKVDAVTGIGPIVTEELVNAVCKYMKEVAELQHGMVMPRNIRHYNCPPLEVLQY